MSGPMVAESAAMVGAASVRGAAMVGAASVRGAAGDRTAKDGAAKDGAATRRLSIGVLALQGGVAPHLEALPPLAAAARDAGGRRLASRRVLIPADLDGLDGLILPGGESTAVGKLLAEGGLRDALRERIAGGMAAWGTCMGAILLAADIANDGRRHLALMDMAVERNAYGSQLDSFRIPHEIDGAAGGPFPMVFIRAPVIRSVGESVRVLARVDGAIVACAQGRLLATTFHPELSDDLRVHALFAAMARS